MLILGRMFRVMLWCAGAACLAAGPVTAQPTIPARPFPPIALPEWSLVPMGAARTLFTDKPECIVSAQNRIDCFVLGDSVVGNPASGDAGSVFRSSWDGTNWLPWAAASPPGFAERQPADRASRPGHLSCMAASGGVMGCYLVGNFSPGALPQNAVIRLAGGLFGSVGPALWWSDLGTATQARPARFAGTPRCFATPNNVISCAVFEQTTPLTGTVYTRLLSNGLWGPWSDAFEGGDAPFWTCAPRADGRIDCIVSSRSVDPQTRAGTPFLRHVVYDPNGAQGGYQPGADLRGAVPTDIASDPQCVNAPDQLVCFVLLDSGTGAGALPARLILQHQPGATWASEPIGFRLSGPVFTAADIADFDCATGATSNDIDCFVGLRTGRIARYTKSGAQENDWRLIDTKTPLGDPVNAIACELSADRVKKHCFAVSSSGRAMDPVRMRHIVLDSILPALRPIRPFRPFRVPNPPVVNPGPPPNP